MTRPCDPFGLCLPEHERRALWGLDPAPQAASPAQSDVLQGWTIEGARHQPWGLVEIQARAPVSEEECAHGAVIPRVRLFEPEELERIYKTGRHAKPVPAQVPAPVDGAMDYADGFPGLELRDAVARLSRAARRIQERQPDPTLTPLANDLVLLCDTLEAAVARERSILAGRHAESTPAQVTVPGVTHERVWCDEHRCYVCDGTPAEQPRCAHTGSTTPCGGEHHLMHARWERRSWTIARPVDWPPGLDFAEVLTHTRAVLYLNARAANGCIRIGVETLADLVVLRRVDLLRVRGMGLRSVADVESELARLGLSLGMGVRT